MGAGREGAESLRVLWLLLLLEKIRNKLLLVLPNMVVDRAGFKTLLFKKILEAIQVSADECMDKQNVSHSCNGILFSLTKEGHSDPCSS